MDTNDTNDFVSLIEALNYAQRRPFLALAKKVLELEHSVFLGRKGDTASDIATSLGAHGYANTVRSYVEGIIDDVKAGDFKNADDIHERINEIEVTYTREALETLLHSDNDSTYWDQVGGENPGWACLATYALQADIHDRLSRALDVDEIREEECAQCGTVVIYKADTEDCPKCDLPLSTEVRQGYTCDEETICVDCVKKGEEGTTHLPNKTHFTCARCDQSCFSLSEKEG